MHSHKLLIAACAAASLAAKVTNPHDRAQSFARPQVVKRTAEVPRIEKRSVSQYLSDDTQKFAVNGSGIPEVDFDAGESYAGTLSIDDNADNDNQLFFWFWPSENPNATDEIVIWLNGGPGCSSLDGFFQENGPILWQSGTYKPQPNPFSWTNLTNMVWVDQPAGTGLGTSDNSTVANITNEVDVGRDFAGFWKNFVTTFNMTGRKVYITGESYAGQYIPYIAQYMLQQNDTDYFNVKGIQINDPSINDDAVLTYAPAVTHLNNYLPVFGLNDSFVQSINQRAEDCGYFDFMEKALTFPPQGKLTPPNATAEGCAVWDDISNAAIYVNPCFNFYHLTDFCPFIWDVMGFPSLAGGPNNYFNRSDVQKALHASADYAVCGDDNLGLRAVGDQSDPSSYEAIPYVIEKTNNVIVGHGLLDYLLLANGTLASLNNMTWNGAQGFSTAPKDDFNVPYNPSIDFVVYETSQQPIPATPVGLVSGGGVMGTTITERGLTFVTVTLAGHEIPQYVASASYRQLEFLLGRISSLTQIDDSFTTQSGNYSGSTPPTPDYSETSSSEAPSSSTGAPVAKLPKRIVW